MFADIILPPSQSIFEGLCDFTIFGALEQQIFRAIDFRGFRQDGSTTMGNQKIARSAQGRVRRHARPAV